MKKQPQKNQQIIPEEQLFEQAKTLFDQGRIRDAREAYKTLVKIDKDKYFSGLVACYKAQIDQMLAKGLISEAKTVQEYLSQLTGEKYSGGQKALIAQTQRAIEKNDYESALQLRMNSDSLVLDEQTLALMVLSNKSPVGLSEEDTQSCLAIQQAMQLLCKSDFVAGTEVLRIVGTGSPFAQWKLFLKGLIAYYSNDDLKAADSFKRLQPDSFYAGAAEPWRLLLDGGDIAKIRANGNKTIVLEGLCFASGLWEYSEIIPRAEYLWQTGRFRDSFKHVASNCPDFPSQKPCVEALLSRFYFNAPFLMNEEKSMDYIDAIMSRFFIKNNVELPYIELKHLLAVRMNASLAMLAGAIDDAVGMWKIYMIGREKLYGKSDLHNASVYARLGELCAKTPRNEFEYFNIRHKKKKALNPDLAKEFLVQSINLDSSNPDVFKTLLNFYQTMGLKSDYNRLLDKAVKLFPDNKEILIQAGDACIKRKTYKKGFASLERALEIDPLDNQVRERLIKEYIAVAKDNLWAIKDKNDYMAQAQRLALSDSDNPALGLGFVLIHKAAFASIIGDIDSARRHLEESSPFFKVVAVKAYFTFLMFTNYMVPKKFLSEIERVSTLELKSVESSSVVTRILRVFIYSMKMDKYGMLRDESHRMEKLALQVFKSQHNRNDVAEIVEFGIAFSKFKLARKYTETILASDPQDPLFLYYKISLEMKVNGIKANFPKIEQDLKKALHLAEQRHDQKALEMIKSTLNDIDRYNRMGDFFSDPYDDEFDDDDDDDDDEVNEEHFEQQMKEFFSEEIKPKKRDKIKPDAEQLNLPF